MPLGLAASPSRDAARPRPRAARARRAARPSRRAPGELSGGEQQRVALCAALAHRPRLLIADEPTGELDGASADVVYGLLAELAREQGATALVVSHDPRRPRSPTASSTFATVGSARSGARGAGGRGRPRWLAADPGGDAPRRRHRRPRPRDARATAPSSSARSASAQREDPSCRASRDAAGARVEARGLTRRYGARLALDGGHRDLRAGAPHGGDRARPGRASRRCSRSLAGLDVPDEGEVVIGGVTVSALDRDGRAALPSRHVAFVGQSPGLSGFLSARENVELGLAVRGIEGVEAHERSGDALAAVGLVEHADRQVALLSAGQRERVAVARALAARPAVILADEPTARIDVAADARARRPLRRHRERVRDDVRLRHPRPGPDRLADDQVRLARRPRYHRPADGDAERDDPGHGHPLRAVRQPPRGRAARPRGARLRERQPDGAGDAPVRRRDDIARRARRGDGARPASTRSSSSDPVIARE